MIRSLLVLVVTLGCALGAAMGDEKPAIFQDLTIDAAKAATKEQGKLLLVDATAVWCGPCKMMDRQTWSNDGVIAWIKANAVAIQIDVDEQREVSQALQIQAMPTVIVFRDGEEIDRGVGMKKPDEFLEWMANVKAGRTSGVVLQENLEALRSGERQMGMQERLSLADDLMRAGRLDEATEEFVWLWGNMAKREPSMIGVRGSFMAGSMQRLASMHAPAQREFVKLRDTEEAKLTDTRVADRDDWILLNEIVGDDLRTLEWFDQIKSDPKQRKALESLGFRIERLLERHGRWADRARFIPSAQAFFREKVRFSEMRDQALEARAGDDDELRELTKGFFYDDIAKAYASLLAADREKSAEWLANAMREHDSSPAATIKLVEWALVAEEPREEHRAWLKDAAERGGDTEAVAQQLEEALGAPAGE